MNKARGLAAAQGRRLRIMFADEARFGRMNQHSSARAGHQSARGPRSPRSSFANISISTGAGVAPKDGTCVYLIMPTSNTACFQVFLDVLARKFARQDILAGSQRGAPNHRCGDTCRSRTTFTLLYLHRRIRLSSMEGTNLVG